MCMLLFLAALMVIIISFLLMIMVKFVIRFLMVNVPFLHLILVKFLVRFFKEFHQLIVTTQIIPILSQGPIHFPSATNRSFLFLIKAIINIPYQVRVLPSLLDIP